MAHLLMNTLEIFWVLFLSVGALQSGPANRWPPIEPIDRKYRFSSMQQAKLRTVILGENGESLYILECYSFGTVPKTGEFMYSGDFECRLHSSDNRYHESTLLTELTNADADWESRGRFLSEQLVAPCGDYKNLGRTRSFRLRGFRLDLKLSNVVFDESQRSFSQMAPALKSFNMELVVTSDPSAKSAVTAIPNLPDRDDLPEPCCKAFDTLYLKQFNQRAVHEHAKP
jgi:hypothetical protein